MRQPGTPVGGTSSVHLRAAELACFALDHDQPPEAVSIRHRDALYAVAAPFDRVPELLARTVDTGASYGAGRARQASWAGARSSG